MSVLTLSIKFGVAAPFELHERHKELYRHLRGVFFGAPFTSDEAGASRVIPVASEHSLSERAFMELLRGPILDSKATRVLIDVGGPDEQNMVRYNILMGLVVAISNFLRANPEMQFGLFFPIKLDDDDVYSPALQKLAEDERVRLLFGDGNSWGKYFAEFPPPHDGVSSWLKDAKTSILDLLERKLIRRVGYYELGDSGQKLLHYYDGQKAGSEIYSLVVEYLREQNNKRKIANILIDARQSNWFSTPVHAALIETELASVAKEIVADSEVLDIGSDTVLLVPIIRTGQTVRQFSGVIPSALGSLLRGSGHC